MSNEFKDFLIPYYNSYINNKEIILNNPNIIDFSNFIYFINNDNNNFYDIYTFYNDKIYYVDFNKNYNINNSSLFGSLFYDINDNKFNIIKSWKDNNICYGIFYNNIDNNYKICKIENNNILIFNFNLPININNIYLQKFNINNELFFAFII